MGFADDLDTAFRIKRVDHCFITSALGPESLIILLEIVGLGRHRAGPPTGWCKWSEMRGDIDSDKDSTSKRNVSLLRMVFDNIASSLSTVGDYGFLYREINIDPLLWRSSSKLLCPAATAQWRIPFGRKAPKQKYPPFCQTRRGTASGKCFRWHERLGNNFNLCIWTNVPPHHSVHPPIPFTSLNSNTSYSRLNNSILR